MFRVREGVGGDLSTENPSVSRFEQGRGGDGGGGVLTEETPPSVSRSSEGGGWRGYVDQEPLRLAIQAREGLVVMR